MPVLMAWASGLLFAAALRLSLDALPSADYSLAAALAGLAVALALGVAASLLPARFAAPTALGAWAGLAFLAGGPAPALSAAGITFAAVIWSRAPALHAGFALGFAIAFARLAARRLADSFAPALPLPALIAFGVGLAALVVISRLGGARTAALAIGFVSLAACAGFAGFRVRAGALLPLPANAAPEGAPNIVLIVLDTVAADHLRAYGGARDTMPELERFAARHSRARFLEWAFSTDSWTLPGHASLLTGLLPSEHGLHMNAFGPTQEPAPIELRAPATLAELARARGFRTGAAIANGMLSLGRGLERGFEVWSKPGAIAADPGVAGELLRAFAWERFVHEFAPYPRAARVGRDLLRISARCAEGPCFLFANYMDAHAPYLPPAPQRGRFWPGPAPAGAGEIARVTDSQEQREFARARYDEAIASLDVELARTLAELERRGVLGNAWLVVTSDHGEGFGADHPTEHGTSLFNDQVRVPLLVMTPPDVAPLEAAGSVSLRDVAATLAAALGSPRFGGGVDLRAPLPSGHSAQLEFSGDRRAHRRAQCGALAAIPARAAVQGTRKLIEQGGALTRFDLARDPHERMPLAALAGEDALRALLPAGIALGGAAAGELDAQQRRELEALGYLEPSE